MQPELIAVLGTLSGAGLVGVITYFSNRSIKNHEWRLGLVRDQLAMRQKLYAAFLVEVQRVTMLAREDKITSLSALDEVNGKFAEICLVASDTVIAEAKELADYAITSHSVPSPVEVRDFFSLKRSFIAAARADMEQMFQQA